MKIIGAGLCSTIYIGTWAVTLARRQGKIGWKEWMDRRDDVQEKGDFDFQADVRVDLGVRW
jgi:hypothetical protein